MATSVLLATTIPGAYLPAQSTTPAAATPSATLEIPTLVVDHNHRPVGDVKASQFRIKIDDQQPFNPTAMHIEGTEPVALMVLLDASRDSFHDLAKIGDELASLTPEYLLPTDNVSLYAADCNMVRSLYNAQPDAEKLRKAVKDAMTFPSLHDGKNGSACGKSMHLWDDVSSAVLAVSKLPGRKVVLIVSAGADTASKYSWKTVADYATDQHVALFGVRDQRLVDADTYTLGSMGAGRGVGPSNEMTPVAAKRKATNFELLCANAGGLTLNYEPLLRKETLAYFLFILRHRFILEIPAAAYPSGKEHQVKVSLPLTPYFVSPAGVGQPLTP
jgi:hypothetical protein